MFANIKKLKVYFQFFHNSQQKCFPEKKENNIKQEIRQEKSGSNLGAE